MSNIIRNINLFEGGPSTVPTIYIWAQGRENCMDLEKFMHDELGYVYKVNHHVSNKYILKDHSTIVEVTFHTFDLDEKTFTAYGSLEVNGEKKLLFPEDKHLIKQHLIKQPSYKPRKMDRTLESLNEAIENKEIANTYYFKKYNTWVMVFDYDVNEGRYDRMVQAMKEIFGFPDRFLGNITGYRRYRREGKFVYSIHKYPGGTFDFGWDQFEDFDSQVDESDRYPKVFGIDDVDSKEKILSILNRGMVAPTYNPKKIDRTLEGLEYRPYRFKTEQEMIDEYGEDWRNHNEGTYFDEGMDYLLGMPLEHGFSDDADEISIPRKDNEDNVWWIVRSFITNNEKSKPDYSPRRVERTLENFNSKKYKYRFLLFKFDGLPDVEKIVTFFHDKYGVEKNETIDFIINDIIRIAMRDNYKIISVHLDGQFGLLSSLDIESRLRYDTTNDPNIYTVNDLYKFEDKPNYMPRKMDRTLECINSLNEAYFLTNEEIDKWSDEYTSNNKPTLRIGDEVKLVDNHLLIYRKYNDKGVAVYYEQYGFIDKYKNKVLKITSKFKANGNQYPWWSRVEPMGVVLSDSGRNNCYLLDDTLVKHLNEPNYMPRRIDRTLESVTNKYNYDVHDSYYFKKFNSFVVVFNKYMDFDVHNNVINMLSEVFDDCLRTTFYLLKLLTEIPNDEDDYYICFTFDEHAKKWYTGWCNLGYLEDDFKHNPWKKIPRYFKYNDIDTWDKLKRVLDSGGIAPTYNPRKISRMTESVVSEYKYEGLSFKINKVSDIDLIIDYFYKKYDVENYENLQEVIDTFRIMYNASDNNCLIVLLKDREFMLVSGRIIEKYITVFELNPTIYTVDDLKNFNRNLEIRPSYTPRKIDRTLEKVEYWPYRFKTEEELLDEYGNNWRRIVFHELGFTFVEEMDYLLGQDVKMELPKYWRKIRYVTNRPEFGTDSWAISPDYITKNKPQIPSYIPRKIDRTLESTEMYKYRIKTKKEFEEEFGENWVDEIALGWTPSMDEYFGEPVNIKVSKEDMVRGKMGVLVHLGQWNFSWDMITENKPKIPNYTPKKIKRDI